MIQACVKCESLSGETVLSAHAHTRAHAFVWSLLERVVLLVCWPVSVIKKQIVVSNCQEKDRFCYVCVSREDLCGFLCSFFFFFSVLIEKAKKIRLTTDES